MPAPGTDDIASLASTPVTIDAGATASEAAQLMGTAHIGSLVVTEDDEPVGLVTDRDLTMAALLRPAGSAMPTVGSVASRPLMSIDVDGTLVDATILFQKHCVRRVGVRNKDGALVGIIAADSIMQALGGPLDDLSHALARELSEERSPSPTDRSTFGPE